METKATRQIVLYREFTYFFSMFILSTSVSFLTQVGWGAPLGASFYYVLNQLIPSVSMGQWSWVIQGAVILVMIGIVREFHWWYVLSAFTSFLYGFFLDITQTLYSFMHLTGFLEKTLVFAVAFLLMGFGISLFMKSDMPLLAFDLIVKEVVRVKKYRVGIVKTIFDITLLLCALGVGLFFYHRPVGLGMATVILTFFTGAYIEKIEPWMKRTFVFKSAWKGKKEQNEK